MRKNIFFLILLTNSFVFFNINNCNALALDEDLNSDGQKDVIIEGHNVEIPGAYTEMFYKNSGLAYRHAEFDTNFDGNIDVIIDFGSPCGIIKQDFNFDGKFDATSGLIHVAPIWLVSYVPWPGWPANFDTWYVIENAKYTCQHVNQLKSNTDEDIKNYLYGEKKKALSDIYKIDSKAKPLISYLSDIYTVARSNYVTEIEGMLKKVININTTDKNGDTLLIKAIKKGNLEAIKLLINRGADVNIKNNEGVTALMLIGKLENSPYSELLRLQGKDPTFAQEIIESLRKIEQKK